MILAPHRVTDKIQRQQVKTEILPPHNLTDIKLKGAVQTGFKLATDSTTRGWHSNNISYFDLRPR